MPPSPTHPVDVLLLLTEGPSVLLALRSGTGYADGRWNLPSGKVELGEDVETALRRESAEEVALKFAPGEPRLVTVVNQRTPTGQSRVGLVFTVALDRARHGAPQNAEPHKCAEIAWFLPDALPPDTDGYTAACVTAWQTGTPLYLNDWP